MGELIGALFTRLAEMFSGLIPERYKLAGRTGPIWRRVLISLLLGVGSLVIGLALAASVTAAVFVIAALVLAIFNLF
jgi:uncharacterized RDD family membrane protein YckC